MRWMTNTMINQLSISTKFEISDAQNWMKNICGQHDLIVKNKNKLSFQHEFVHLAPNSTALGYVKYGTDVSIVNEKKLHCYSISLPLSGEQELTIQNNQILSNKDIGLILNPQEELSLNISGDCKKIHLAIPKTKIDQILKQLIRQDITDDLIFSSEMYLDSTQIAHWWRQINFYLDEISIFGMNALQLMYPEIESLLIKKLLILQKHNYSDLLHQQLNAHFPKELQSVISYIDLHAHQPISLQNLCEISCSSASKLNFLFNEYYHVPPMQYLKQIRLKNAYEMISQQPFLNISEIALLNGFNHLGHFSHDYKKMFNETPKQTAKRFYKN